MRRILLLVVAGWGALLAGGCATALNLQDETLRKPYGGFTMRPDDFFGGGYSGEMATLLFWPMWLLDKPLSLFGDTLSLPYTLWVHHDDGLFPTTPTAGVKQPTAPDGGSPQDR